MPLRYSVILAAFVAGCGGTQTAPVEPAEKVTTLPSETPPLTSAWFRKFDSKTGAPKGEVAIPEATFLDDIAVAKDGRVFVSDTGLKAGSVEHSGRDGGGSFVVAYQGFTGGAADIGLDTKRKRLLVPRFQDNAVEAFALK